MFSSYFFLELAIIVYLLGFCWEYLDLREFRRRSFWWAATVLAIVWFVLDQIALWLGLWVFPEGTTSSLRAFSLPAEEYAIFVLHTVLCLVLLRQYAGPFR